MDLFDDGKKPKYPGVDFQGSMPTHSIEVLIEKFDLDLKLQVMGAAFSRDLSYVYRAITICSMVASIRSMKLGHKKVSPKEKQVYEESFAMLLAMMRDPQQPWD